MNTSELPGITDIIFSGEPLVTGLLIASVAFLIISIRTIITLLEDAPAVPIIAIALFGISGIWANAHINDQLGEQTTETLDAWVLETYGVDDSVALDSSWNGEPITLTSENHVYQLMTTAGGQILLVDAGGREVPRI